MAGGALLGVKILRRNAEHIVTLDAHAMKNRLSRRGRLVARSMRLRRSLGPGFGGFSCHSESLAHRQESQHLSDPRGVGAASFSGRSRIPFDAVGVVQHHRRLIVRRLKLC